MEVAGLVLGALPLAIKALNSYRSILSSLKNVKRDLDFLVRDLETEHQILQNTCETLLKGIVPDSRLDEMIENPFGADWRGFDDQIRLRLWRSHSAFQQRLTEMHGATKELQQMLAIQEDRKTKLTDARSILNEIKHRTGFTLKKKDYTSTLTRIKEGNSVLLKLTQQNNELEPSRRSRSQAKVARLIRQLSRSIFNALRGAMTCSCAKIHNIGLELVPRNTVMIHGELEDDVARTLSFHVVFGSLHAYAQEPQRWDSLSVRLAAKEEATNQANTPPLRDAVYFTPPKRRRAVGWASAFSTNFKPGKDATSSTTQTLLQAAATSILPATTTFVLPTVTDLCQLVRAGKSTAADCYGLVTDVEHKFELYPQPNQTEARSFVTLRQVLKESEKGNLSPPFGYPEQLKLALALSTSVLHLYNTPWLARIVTLDDVVFLRETSLNYHSPYQPFVTKDFPPQPNSQPQQMHPLLPGRLRPMDLTVLSLGTLLIQIITGRRIADLDLDLGGSGSGSGSGSGTNLNSVLSKKEAASQLAGPVLQCGGMNYESAVQWCLGSILGVAGLEDDHFCQNFYEGVVARLEADSRIQQR